MRMQNLILVPISIDDMEILNLTEYNNLSKESKRLGAGTWSIFGGHGGKKEYFPQIIK